MASLSENDTRNFFLDSRVDEVVLKLEYLPAIFEEEREERERIPCPWFQRPTWVAQRCPVRLFVEVMRSGVPVLPGSHDHLGSVILEPQSWVGTGNLGSTVGMRNSQTKARDQSSSSLNDLR